MGKSECKRHAWLPSSEETREVREFVCVHERNCEVLCCAVVYRDI